MTVNTVSTFLTSTVMAVGVTFSAYAGNLTETDDDTSHLRRVRCSAGTMNTQWGDKVTTDNAWREYPRPQLVRENWQCLNGEWEYAVTTALQNRPDTMDGTILVPFCFESVLSGVGRDIAPTERMWYRRNFEVAESAPLDRLLLHFDGVDYRAQVFINGLETLDVPHEGPYAFTVDITDYVRTGTNILEVLAWDPTGENGCVPYGKQSLVPKRTRYHRVSGIWQSVWCERVPATHLKSYKTLPDIDNGVIRVKPVLDGDLINASVTVEVRDGNAVLASADVTTLTGWTDLTMPAGFGLWSPSSPKLHDLVFTVRDRRTGTCDVARGYFGMRKFGKRRDANGVWRVFVNNEPLYLMGTLEMGYWPDGIWTPPSDEAIIADIQFLKDAGFNCARKHQKVEPLRWYYHCDTMGLIILQDLDAQGGTWMVNETTAESHDRMIAAHRREIKRRMDMLEAEPCIACWIPYNEGVTQPWAFQTHQATSWVKRRDPSRLVDGPSGFYDFDGGNATNVDGPHIATNPTSVPEERGDMIDMHSYPEPNAFAADPDRISFLGEWGGIALKIDGHQWSDGGWGYVEATSLADFESRYLGMVKTLETLAANGLAGSIYTQTTDCETEINGLVTYDRKVVKINLENARAAHERVIAAGAGAK